MAQHLYRYFGVGEESIFGTPVALTDFIPIENEGIEPTQEHIRPETIAYMMPVGSAPGKYAVGGSVSGYVDTELKFLELILLALMGEPATNGPGGDGEYTHAFTGYDGTETPASLTMAKSPGLGGAETYAIQYVSCGVTSLVLEFKAVDKIAYTFDMFGQKDKRIDTEASSYTTLTALTGSAVAVMDPLTYVDGSDTAPGKVMSMSLTVALALDDDAYYLGSRFIGDLHFDGGYTVSGEMEILFKNWGHYSDFWAGYQESISLTTASGVWVVGEVVTGGTSGATATIVRIDDNDSATPTLYLTSIHTEFTTTETITGAAGTGSRNVGTKVTEPADSYDPKDINVTITGDLIAGTTYHSLTIDLPKVLYNSISCNETAMNKIVHSISFDCDYSTADSYGFSFTVVNDSVTI